MTRPPINPNAVAWMGENPGMYLRDTADGPFVSLISFFRVNRSPHGRGHAAFILLSPNQASASDNFLLTDNEPLANYLKEDFVTKFGAFRAARGLEGIRVAPAWDFSFSGDGSTSHSEIFNSAVGSVRLEWSELSEPYFAEMLVDRTATGEHEMFSVFLDARRASASINGRLVNGKPFPRDLAGKQGMTAFLAMAESWISLGK